jgi:hypothetical protein
VRRRRWAIARELCLSSAPLQRARLRYLLLPAFPVRDATRALIASIVPPRVGVPDNALSAAIGWLCATHDVTGRRGSSKGYTLLHGWLPAYPETTGYILGTLLEYARRSGARPDLVERAVQMGRWEEGIQESDGGIMEGHVETRPRRSIVFNTGMVLHGWIDLVEAGHQQFEASAERACQFLVTNLTGDGTWRPEVEYAGIPHTYNTRVAWAMIRWARHTGSEAPESAARAHLDWVCSVQQPNGWFESCSFRTGMVPSTHAIAYTLRGLLESYCLLGDERLLQAVQRTAHELISQLDRTPMLPANFDRDWSPATNYSCLTGTVQLGGVWLRLFQETGDQRWLNAGLKAVEQAAARQETTRLAPVHGALAGSFPIFGRYAPLQYPNWATKFLADSLMLYDDCLQGAPAGGTGSVTPART